jgi:hypothetical protein
MRLGSIIRDEYKDAAPTQEHSSDHVGIIAEPGLARWWL